MRRVHTTRRRSANWSSPLHCADDARCKLPSLTFGSLGKKLWLTFVHLSFTAVPVQSGSCLTEDASRHEAQNR